MGYDQNPYQAYTDGSIFSDSPLNLVVALYQGALDATQQAESAIQARDILGRTRAINKAHSIITELLMSLDLERGGEIALNLKALYVYMQEQLLKANLRQAAEPIIEVSKLLSTLLGAWREATKTQVSVAESAPAMSAFASVTPEHVSASFVSAPVYGGYLDEGMAACASTGYSF